MVRDVVILREETSTRGEHPGNLAQARLPVSDVVKDRKVEDGVEVSDWELKVSDIAGPDRGSAAVSGQSALRPSDHLRVEVDGSNALGAEHVQLARDAFTGTASNVQDRKSPGSTTQFDEFWDDVPTEPPSAETATDV